MLCYGYISCNKTEKILLEIVKESYILRVEKWMVRSRCSSEIL